MVRPCWKLMFFWCVFMWMFVSVLEMEWTFNYLSTDSLVITWSCCITVAYVTDATTSPSPSESTYCWFGWVQRIVSLVGSEHLSAYDVHAPTDIWKSQFCIITICANLMYINLFIYLYIYSHTMHLHCSIYTLYHGNCSIIHYHSSFQHTVFTCFYWWFGAFGGLDSDFSSPYESGIGFLGYSDSNPKPAISNPPRWGDFCPETQFQYEPFEGRSLHGYLGFSPTAGGFDGGWVFCLKVGKFMCHIFLCRISEFNINFWKILFCEYYVLGFCRVTHSRGCFYSVCISWTFLFLGFGLCLTHTLDRNLCFNHVKPLYCLGCACWWEVRVELHNVTGKLVLSCIYS